LNYFEERIDLYLEQFEELHNYYPNLKYQMESENLFLRGEVCFNEDFGTGFWINDCYLMEIAFPPDYPDSLPFVREIGGKIENNYPHFLNKDEKTLCLGTWTDLWFHFSQKKTILYFVYDLLIPALYTHAYWKKKKTMPPWGDRPHGGLGPADFFADMFKVYDLFQIIQLLLAFLGFSFKWDSQCPCGRKMALNECHGIQLKHLRGVPRKYLWNETSIMLRDYFKIYEKPLGKKRIGK
jgi:ubiquitin-protein ligase